MFPRANETPYEVNHQEPCTLCLKNTNCVAGDQKSHVKHVYGMQYDINNNDISLNFYSAF